MHLKYIKGNGLSLICFFGFLFYYFVLVEIALWDEESILFSIANINSSHCLSSPTNKLYCHPFRSKMFIDFSPNSNILLQLSFPEIQKSIIVYYPKMDIFHNTHNFKLVHFAQSTSASVDVKIIDWIQHLPLFFLFSLQFELKMKIARVFLHDTEYFGIVISRCDGILYCKHKMATKKQLQTEQNREKIRTK